MLRTIFSFSQLARRLLSSRPIKFGLNEEEVTNLQSGWKVVDESPIPVAKIIFKDLFDKKPEYQKKFPGYDRDRPLLHQKQFVPHMKAVVSSLTRIVKKLEDAEEVDRMMDYIVSSYHSYWEAEKEMGDMGQSIKSSLRALNKNKDTSGFDVAFDKFWKSFMDDYMDRLNKLNKSNKGGTGKTEK